MVSKTLKITTAISVMTVVIICIVVPALGKFKDGRNLMTVIQQIHISTDFRRGQLEGD